MSKFPSTPHINVLDDIGFGKTVLMPGDPLRAKLIAETFLEDRVLVNNVRGVNGYTGYSIRKFLLIQIQREKIRN